MFGLKNHRGMSGAVRRAASGEGANARSVIESMGGIRGLLESSAAGVLFLLVYTITTNPVQAALISLCVAFGLVFLRIKRRENPLSALYGVAAVGVCVLLVLITGRGQTYYLPGFWINGAWAAAILVSLLLRWPLLGLITGVFTGSFTAWRKSLPLRRVVWGFTIAWLALFVLRLGVQLPLYFAGNVEGLGVARLVMGLPLYGLLLFLTWRGFAAAFALEKQRSQVILEG